MASKVTPRLAAFMRQTFPRTLRLSYSLQAILHRPHPIIAPSSSSSILRFAHTIPRPPRSYPTPKPTEQQEENEDTPSNESERPEAKGPAYYQLSFTCVPCGHRSHHNVSKQGYHFGSTLITCPSCRNRHVISDHLNIFGDRKITVEDLMREKGQLVKRGSLGEDGDIEFWPEETLPEKAEGDGKSGSS